MRSIVLLCVLLSGCSFLSWPGQPANQPKKQFSTEEILTSEPRIVKVRTESGEVVELTIGNATHHEFRTNAEETKAKASFLDKLKALGIAGIILGIASLFFPPLAVVFGMIGRGMEFGATKIVKGVDRALEGMTSQEEKQKFLDTLSKSYDDNTKLLVAKLKNKV